MAQPSSAVWRSGLGREQLSRQKGIYMRRLLTNCKSAEARGTAARSWTRGERDIAVCAIFGHSPVNVGREAARVGRAREAR